MNKLIVEPFLCTIALNSLQYSIFAMVWFAFNGFLLVKIRHQFCWIFITLRSTNLRSLRNRISIGIKILPLWLLGTLSSETHFLLWTSILICGLSFRFISCAHDSIFAHLCLTSKLGRIFYRVYLPVKNNRCKGNIGRVMSTHNDDFRRKLFFWEDRLRLWASFL